MKHTPVDFDPFAETVEDTVLPLSEAQQEMWAASASEGTWRMPERRRGKH